MSAFLLAAAFAAIGGYIGYRVGVARTARAYERKLQGLREATYSRGYRQ